MKRIYSNYSEEDFNLVKNMASELGFSMSSFQHYCVMLYADSRNNTTSTSRLLSEMFTNLESVAVKEPFIVSSLLADKWPSLKRNVKITLAKQLAIYIRNNNDKFEIHNTTKGKTTVYIRKK